jgi:predicted small integral membrane protein
MDEAATHVTVRSGKLAVTAGLAAFFLLVAFGNVIDHDTNWQFVRHVMAMDTTFHSPALMWRAVTDESMQRLAYWLIIGWELATGTVLLMAAVLMAARLKLPTFATARAVAVVGLVMGFLLYGVGFLVVASEWFAMWQSQTWNAQATAGMFTTVLLAALAFVAPAES